MAFARKNDFPLRKLRNGKITDLLQKKQKAKHKESLWEMT